MVSQANASKKCPSCGQWSPSTGQFDQICTHCGQYLNPIEVQREKAEQEKLERKKKYPWEDTIYIVTIKPEDPLVLKWLKRLVQFGQIIFVTIVSILLWISVAMAG